MNIFLALLPIFASIDPALLGESTPFSPPSHFEERYRESVSEFQMRWEKFAAGRSFVLWTPGRTSDSIADEFCRVREERLDIWFEKHGKLYRSHPDYTIAEEMIHYDCVREANCIPFNYNKACTYYNASLVETESRRFIAMMGPRDKDLLSFFRLLIDASVGVLVRLTPAWEGAVSKCHPYWEGIVQDESLHIPFGRETYSVPYFTIENWKDNKGNEPIELFEFVQRIRKSHDPMSGPLAVHCTNGVGRTGTVIAAIALLDEAEKQIESGVPIDQIQISVEETVYKLSLQRFYMCAQIPQYESLYRVLELYVNSLRHIACSES